MTNNILDYKDYFKNVPRGTFQRLEKYTELLLKWNSSINLIGKSTEEDVRLRHIVDSAQVYDHIPKTIKTLTDVGTGAGLPGMVLAILGVPEVHLIESDNKKTIFLQETKRLLGLDNITIHNQRVENITPWKSDVITSRAFASVEKILELTHPFMHKDSLNILQKGSSVGEEMTNLDKKWDMDIKKNPSITDPRSSIIVITNLKVNS